MNFVVFQWMLSSVPVALFIFYLFECWCFFLLHSSHALLACYEARRNDRTSEFICIRKNSFSYSTQAGNIKLWRNPECSNVIFYLIGIFLHLNFCKGIYRMRMRWPVTRIVRVYRLSIAHKIIIHEVFHLFRMSGKHKPNTKCAKI